MTERSRPWTGVVTGDAGPYSDSNWREIWAAIIGWGGSRANVGVFLSSGAQPYNGLRVQAQGTPGTSIEILSGAALIQGLVYINTATLTQAIAPNASGNARIDTVIIRVDYALQTARQTLLQGTPAASPVSPTLTQNAGVMWDIPLADIAVANGFVTITNANITPRHEWVNAPPGIYLDNIVNNSGATRNTGDVVVWDSTADRAVTTTTTRDAKAVAGVWQGKTAASGYGRVLKTGIGYVYANSAVTRGDLLTTSTTAGQVQRITSPDGVWNGYVGRALETTSGAGYVLAFIDAHVVSDVDLVVVAEQQNNGVASASITSGAWRTRVINTELVDTGGIASVNAGNNRTTLPRGRYTVEAIAPSGANLTAHRCRVRDITNGVTLALGAGANNTGTTVAFGAFELTGSADIELQHWVNTTGSGGIAVSTGDVEIYSIMKFQRFVETA